MCNNFLLCGILLCLLKRSPGWRSSLPIWVSQFQLVFEIWESGGRAVLCGEYFLYFLHNFDWTSLTEVITVIFGKIYY